MTKLGRLRVRHVNNLTVAAPAQSGLARYESPFVRGSRPPFSENLLHLLFVDLMVVDVRVSSRRVYEEPDVHYFSFYNGDTANRNASRT